MSIPAPLPSCALALLCGAVALGAAALPATASAADTIGGDLSRSYDQALRCSDDVSGAGVPCTLVLDKRGLGDVTIPEQTVITEWSAALVPGGQARLRLLRRNDDGTFTSAGATSMVTGSGGVERFRAHLVVPATGSYTFGIDLPAAATGQIGAVADDAWTLRSAEPAIGDGETRRPGGGAAYELMAAVRAEADVDGDGLGDESEDSCVGTCGGGGNGGGDDGGGGGSGGDGGGSGGGGKGGGSGSGGGRRGVHLTIDKRSILRPGAAGKSGYIEVYVSNDGSTNLDGTIEVRLGKRLLGKGTIDDLDYGTDYQWGLFRLPKAEVARLLRRGTLKGVKATARVKSADGRTATFAQPITIHRGGAAGYDGVYRGPGPVTVTVERGVLVSITTQLMLFCQKLNVMRTRPFFALSGFPTLIRRDGSFAAKGSRSGDSLRYNGKLSPRGTSRGYLSVFHTELWLGEGGKLQSDTCFQAKNWTARRSRR